MSVKALGWAWDADLNDPLAKLVLLAVADHYNESMQQAWPSVNRLSKMCGCSRATTLRKLKFLEENGFVKRQRRFNKSNIYVLILTSQPDTPYHTDTSNTPLEVSQCDPNLYNNLTIINKSEKFKPQRKTLSDKQKAFAEQVAQKMFAAYKAEGFYYKHILADVERFFLTKQSAADWQEIGNGMDNPKDRGWM